MRLALATIAAILPTIALAQSAPPPQFTRLKCGDKASQEEHLLSEYNEVPLWVGIVPDGREVVLYLNPTGSTFTIMIHWDETTTCMAFTGSAYQFLPYVKPAPEEEG